MPKFGIEGPVYLTAKGSDAEANFTIDEVRYDMLSWLTAYSLKKVSGYREYPEWPVRLTAKGSDAEAPSP